MKQLWEARIVNGYRAKGKRYDPVKGHTGIDQNYDNEPISAPCDLTIIATSTQPQMGKTIYAKDAEGLIHVYCHLSKIIYPTGGEVKKGEILAISGNTGTATSGPHLHFELLAKSGTNPKMKRLLLPFKGDNLDPLPYLSKWRTAKAKTEAVASTGSWVGSLIKKLPFPRWLSNKR